MSEVHGITRGNQSQAACPVEHSPCQEPRVSDVIGASILECAAQTSIKHAARLMRTAQCSSIIIVKDGQAVGIWTERDALRLDLSHAHFLEQPIATVMSSPVKRIPAELTLQEVAVRFSEEGVRHYLVEDDHGVHLGVITQTDIIHNQGLEYFLKLEKLATAVSQQQLVMWAETPLSHVTAAMYDAHVDAVVVRYPEGGLGILTERDVVRLIAQNKVTQTVGELASRPLITLQAETSLYQARNTLLEHHLRHMGVLDGDGELLGIVGFTDIIKGMERAYVRDLKQVLHQREHDLTRSRNSLQLAEKVIESLLEAVMVTDGHGIIESVNPAFCRLTGYSAAEVVGRNHAMLRSGLQDTAFYSQMWQCIQASGHWQGEIWNRRKDGVVFAGLLTIVAINDDNGVVSHYTSLFNDITELKEKEEHITSLAYFDALTGLPNRRLFFDRLEMAIAHAHRCQQRMAVLFLDLDRFKRINDSFGHGVGDQLLQEVSKRLCEQVREGDTVARMGGDEFTVILPDVNSIDEIVTLVRRVIDSMALPFTIGDKELISTCSLGISVYPDDATISPELIQMADTAMYRAKDLGRNSFQLYSPAMNASFVQHLAMEVGLRQALQRDELIVHYQPIIDCHSGELIGAEALLRWQHPELGMVPPSDFIPLAEESELIISIGNWVLRTVAQQLKQWSQAGHPFINVAINISPRQFHQGECLTTTREVLEELDLDPRQISFELTESLLMDNALETIRLLTRIRDLGIGISVDDFGTGYSSLSYLKRFPITRLKIDRSFIRDIQHNPEDKAIVLAIINLAHSLRLAVVAEGVEKREQQQILKQHGCEYVQGFYYSRPIPAELFEQRYFSTGTDSVKHHG